MRYIRNISDDQNKYGDTDEVFRFNLLQGDDIFNFGDYPISVNIANSSGYILSMTPEKEFGNSVIKLDFNNDLLKSLPPDSYLLEVEVTLTDGTVSKFPTSGGMPFTINKDLKGVQGTLVPTVTFDAVLESVDEKIAVYMDTVKVGPKGDTGSSALPVAGVYPTLSALITANPDNTKVYITTENGNWNYWNGTTWATGGVYQSVGIADGSIVNQSLSGLVIDAVIYADMVNGFSDTKFDIDKTNQTLSVKGVYLNYANKSIQIPDATITINNQVNILCFDQTTGVLGVKDSIDKLENSDIYLGVIRQGLSVVDLKVTMYSIDGVIVKPYITNKFLDRKMFIYGDLIFNIDEKQLILNSVYLNYDYGDGLAIPNSTIDLSSIDNKVVYFDVNNQTVKTDYYGHLGDSDIVIGYFNPSNPSTSFNNTVSRVLFIKNGVTYSPEQFKTKGSTLSNVYMSTFGDSITSDQVSGTGTQIMNELGAKNGGNFATGWSTASDWHTGDVNTTTITLTTPQNTDTNDNVLSNQVRRQLQYTTASGQPITWTHPIDGTFVLDSSIGTGLGNTDKVPSVIYIAISTNDGKNDSVPVVDDTDVVFGQSYSQLTRNSLASGLRWAIETLQSAYPDAKIFISSPLQTDRISGHMSFSDGNLKRDVIEKVARFTSIKYIDSFSESGFSALKNKIFTVDGIHPSDVGKKKLVDYVTNEIRKKLG